MKRGTSSRLRHRLILQQEVHTPDGAGGYARSWEDVAGLWAEVTPLTGDASGRGSGRERLIAGKLQSEVSHRVVLRYREGVTAGMRLLFEERPLHILYVVDRDERKELLELLVSEGTAD